MLNVLLSAYSCAPGEGSEPAQGWNTAVGLAKNHNVIVFVGEHYLDLIEKAKIPQNITVYYIGVPFLKKFYAGKGSLFKTIYYYIWQIFALKKGLELEKKVKFDVVHHVTFGKYSVPSFLWILCKNFFYGPVGGAERYEDGFLPYLEKSHRKTEKLRNFSHLLARFDPFLRLCIKNSKKIYVTTKESKNEIDRIGGKNIEMLSQVGLWSNEVKELYTDFEENGELYFLCVGRLLYWKGYSFAIMALAKMYKKNNRLKIIGGGPEISKLRDLAKSAGVADRVDFLGEISRDKVKEHMSSSLALLHPSFHDSGGFVLAEAQSIGCEVICLDYGGPSVLVSSEKNVKIKPKTLISISEKLAVAMDEIVISERYLDNQSRKKRNEWVLENFSWERKLSIYNQDYSNILGVNL